MQDVEVVKYQQKLRKWGLHSYPRNPDRNLYSDAKWLQVVSSYIHTMPGDRIIETSKKGAKSAEKQPNTTTKVPKVIVVSNSSGYFAVVRMKDRVLVFDELSNYTDDRTMRKINGKTFDFLKDEYYSEQCRVLIFDWRNIKKAIKGAAQVRNVTWTDDTFDFSGNTILLELDVKGHPQYRFVMGGYIADFVLTEPVKQFYSFLDNNTAPFPYAVTDTKIYTFDPPMVFEKKDVPEDLDMREDFSEWFWCNGGDLLGKEMKPIYVHLDADLEEKRVEHIEL